MSEAMIFPSEYPIWFDGKKINEALFCEEFLQDHRMLSINDVFFTVNGRVHDENRLKKEIYNRIKPFVTSGIAKKVTNLLDVLRILCSYLAKLLPSDKTQPFDLDNRVKLEYYRLEKTYEGAIELAATPGSWKPTQPKRAGGQKDRLSPLDEIIARINEEFFGDFTDADRVMVDTLYTKMRKDAKVKKAAKSNDRQVYERSIFPGIFDTTAQQAYMENTEAYEQLFLDAEKYRIIQQALAERLYRELHGENN